MISFARPDNFKSSENSAPETGEMDYKPEDFAALINMPVETPNNPALNSVVQNCPAESEEDVHDVTPIKAGIQLIAPENLLAKTVAGQDLQTEKQLPSTDKSINFAKNIISQDFQTKKQLLPADKSINFKTLFAGEKVNSQNRDVLAAQAETIKEGIASGKVEVLKNEEIPKAVTSFLNEAPNVLENEMPSVLKNEPPAKSKTTNSLFDFALENIAGDASAITTQTNSKTADDGSALNLSQPKIEAPKAEKSFKAPEDFSAISFNKILESTSKEAKSADVAQAQQIPVNATDVYRQVEPKVLQLITLNKVENEKKVMKMRLHPAELGTVEIRLERDASGKLTAHFQTENEATLKALHQSLDQLRDSLQNSGYQIERLEISCSPFSAAGQDAAGGQNARQFETVENQLNSKAASDSNLETQVDLKHNESNRLLSMRA